MRCWPRQAPEQQQGSQRHSGDADIPVVLGLLAGNDGSLRCRGSMHADLQRLLVSASWFQRLDRSFAQLGGNLVLPLLILAIPWGQELIDQLFFAGRWNLPMGPGSSFVGVLTAPFSHGGFGHLLANSLVFVPLSWLVLLKGRRDYLAVWLGVYVAAIPVWLLWPTSSHGLSGVVYGLLAYLLLIGWLERRPLSLLLSLLCLISYGGVLPSLLPIFSPVGVSWIGHVSGFGGGLLAAWGMHRSPVDP